MMINQLRLITERKANDMARTTRTTPEATEVAEVIEEITFSAKDLAAEAGAPDAKTFRRFLRSRFPRDVKGERWVFTPELKAEVLAAWATRSTTPEVEADAAE